MQDSSIMTFAEIFSTSVQEIINATTGMKIEASKTVQQIPNVKISGDVGAFVSFKGDYDGIMIMNFSGNAAVEIVSHSLRLMGMPEEEIPINHTSDDVRNNLGELLNQIIGKFRGNVENKYNLVSKANIPAVIPISTPIGLFIESSHVEKQDCVRLSFCTPSSHRFHMEASMEPTKLVVLP